MNQRCIVTPPPLWLTLLSIVITQILLSLPKIVKRIVKKNETGIELLINKKDPIILGNDQWEIKYHDEQRTQKYYEFTKSFVQDKWHSGWSGKFSLVYICFQITSAFVVLGIIFCNSDNYRGSPWDNYQNIYFQIFASGVFQNLYSFVINYQVYDIIRCETLKKQYQLDSIVEIRYVQTKFWFQYYFMFCIGIYGGPLYTNIFPSVGLYAWVVLIFIGLLYILLLSIRNGNMNNKFGLVWIIVNTIILNFVTYTLYVELFYLSYKFYQGEGYINSLIYSLSKSQDYFQYIECSYQNIISFVISLV